MKSTKEDYLDEPIRSLGIVNVRAHMYEDAARIQGRGASIQAGVEGCKRFAKGLLIERLTYYNARGFTLRAILSGIPKRRRRRLFCPLDGAADAVTISHTDCMNWNAGG